MGQQRTNGSSTITELQQAASRVVESVTFSRSPRLRDFLSFVVQCSIDGNCHELNEYSIGVQVFGKHPNYNPNQDNIVRVTARHLRSKLAEYYSDEGKMDPWRVEIPKGGYQATLTPAISADGIQEVRQPVAERRFNLPVAAFAILCAAGWIVAAWQQFRAPAIRPQQAYLLAPILTDRSLPTTIVLDDPIFGKIYWQTGNDVTINDFVNERYLDSKYYSSDQFKLLLTMLEQQTYIDFLSMQTTQRLSNVALSQGVESTTVNCRTLKPEQMKKGNFIFIGGVSANPWVREVQKNLAFEHVVERSRRSRSFVNRSPKPGEPAVFETTDDNPKEQYFTRVAVLKNPYGTGKIALLGGTSRDATEAAGQFALSQTGLDQVQRVCGPLDKLAGFEFILATQSLAGAPLSQHVVASRCNNK